MKLSAAAVFPRSRRGSSFLGYASLGSLDRLSEETTDMRSLLRLAALGFLLTAWPLVTLRAEDSDFRYVRPSGSRAMYFSPRSSFAYVGGQVYYLPTPSSQPPAPNTWLNFRHPYTHAYVSVPVALPSGMPKVEQRSDRVIYDYGTVAVVFHFVRDGTVNISYDLKSR